MVDIRVNVVGDSCHYIKLHFEKSTSKEKLVVLSGVDQLTHMLKNGKAHFSPLYPIYFILLPLICQHHFHSRHKLHKFLLHDSNHFLNTYLINVA